MAALAVSMMLSVAHADEYADVSQLVRNGKLADALTKADQYLATKPRDPQMRFLKGVIQRDSGKTSDAIATFTRLTEDYPELPEPYNNLAVLYAGQSQFDKARTALEMAIRTNPSYTTAHENLGDVYAKLASQAYGKALQLDASNTAVAPKLALIRELFNPAAKGQRPTAAATLPSPVPAVPSAAVVATAPPAKAPPTLPAQAPVKAPPTLATAPAPAATVAVATPPAVTAPPVAAAPTVAATPAPTPTPQPAAAPAHVAANGNKEVEAAVRAWAHAWASKDVKGYLASYGKEFDPPGNANRSAWEEERRQRITSKSKISVKLENLNISVNGNKAVAKFRQDYKANELAVSSRKALDLVKAGERWVIVRESVVN
ncbi:tetratricopeptide repeat protein [Rhodoferax saidenbachensis]|uniref:Tetratricopeptide (TPR) repeat protein n=1 Tax=Rhodoferax saidenbachensis TaxID=1484693 RepID=A0ABU1ZU85_9BURK|nr:tetratricopeptide repeat protein [Rhodoferax saidenbachensis]MDR7308410.1 tetratricopeptide (TPR) repeat protein [Rhodoferax saidenbachensis]